MRLSSAIQREGRTPLALTEPSRNRNDKLNHSEPLEPESQNKGKTGVKWAILALALLVWIWLYRLLPAFSDRLTYGAFGFIKDTPVASAVQFFLYDTPKVLMLLTLVVFFVGIIRSFFTPERTRAMLVGKHELAGTGLAALLGIVTPFCSCSAVPLFIGFVTAGVPLGVTFSFLVSAPMVNEIALALLLASFGWKIAGLYLVTGLSIAFISGTVIGRLKMERFVEPWVYEMQIGQTAPNGKVTWDERFDLGWQAVREIVGKVWPYLLGAIAVGAVIHGWVPEAALAKIMGSGAWWSVPLAVLIGVPLYGNAAAILPIVSALLEKGAALGTTLAFMMAVIGLSLPETIILRKILKPRLIAVFISVVAVGILIVGYLFNAILD